MACNRHGARWFVLADVCRALGIANVGDPAAWLDDDEKDDPGFPMPPVASSTRR